ncbi:MAG: DUF6089 family protein [Spirosomataceae bacterium]
MFKKIIVLVGATLLVAETYAQKIEVGGGVGMLHYKGDISPNFHPSFLRPGGNAFFRYNVSRAVSLKANFMYGQIFADDKQVNDPFNNARGMSFHTSIFEAGANLEYNFLNFKNSPKAKNWTPYVFGGVSFINFDPKEPRTASFGNNSMALPFGIGLKMQWKGPWSWAFEFGTRKTFTDYLDNWGDNSVTPGVQLKQQDQTKKDMYYYTSINIYYTFYKIVCPR